MYVELERIEGRRFAIKARGLEVIVDDTVEAGGPGDGFRPTELLLGALAACMAGTMTNFANGQEIPVGDISMTLSDEVAKAPTRVGRIEIVMSVEADASERQLESLERVAAACKIHNTLGNAPEISLRFQAQ